ncbi:unnamed protein product [Rangifer tarandus platyrhynchus]|uniref:Uncharacterized protein n=2 Tax=Rangifer tarandus platyrhynchus TaxID=3082113 RepID=A0ABN8YCX0_RANTA|nr:unnamed protein product [Rangifer tarandus platyrhynchus]CAI9699780.1 unnamed protein product [Rangifer tarandus platyrhynchus]
MTRKRFLLDLREPLTSISNADGVSSRVALGAPVGCAVLAELEHRLPCAPAGCAPGPAGTWPAACRLRPLPKNQITEFPCLQNVLLASQRPQNKIQALHLGLLIHQDPVPAGPSSPAPVLSPSSLFLRMASWPWRSSWSSSQDLCICPVHSVELLII